MADNFKIFVDQNKDDFERESDKLDGLWLSIASQFEVPDKQQKLIWWLWPLKMTAAALLFVGMAWLVLGNLNFGQTQETGLANISPELAEAEGFYSSMIDAKMKVVQSRADEIDPQIFDDLAALDTAMQELQQDLSDNIDNEEVINAMIQNYRIKLEILERIAQALQKNHDDDEAIQS